MSDCISSSYTCILFSSLFSFSHAFFCSKQILLLYFPHSCKLCIIQYSGSHLPMCQLVTAVSQFQSYPDILFSDVRAGMLQMACLLWSDNCLAGLAMESDCEVEVGEGSPCPVFCLLLLLAFLQKWQQSLALTSRFFKYYQMQFQHDVHSYQ